MPYSAVILEREGGHVTAELQLPVEDLAVASGLDLRTLPTADLPAATPAMRSYLSRHVHPTTDDKPWSVRFADFTIAGTGSYRELIVHAELTPPGGTSATEMTFGYDAIVHEVVTHTVLVSVQDKRVGEIRVDNRTMKVEPLTVAFPAERPWGLLAGAGAVAVLAVALRFRRRRFA
ncbi:hypothetical protein [Paractinoplanes deccanensis]|nr:hypothetical protein [Actinoplanes deccanensis]